MTPETIVKSVSGFGAACPDGVLVLTGGEPFEMPEQLGTALAAAAEFGLKTYVLTSASWAPTLEAARDVLERFTPLSLLSVSADRYHEEFVPLDYVRNALQAAVDIRVDAHLALAIDRDDQAYEARVRQVLGEELWSRTGHQCVPVMPTGRAKANKIGWFDIAPEPLPEGACDLLGTPVVVPDGTVCCCCQIDATNEVAHRPDSVYRLGNIATSTYEELRTKVDRDPLFQALRIWGPRGLVELLVSRGVPLELDATYPGICFLCRSLLTRPRVVAELRKILQDKDTLNDIRLSRILQYGELRPRPASAR